MHKSNTYINTPSPSIPLTGSYTHIESADNVDEWLTGKEAAAFLKISEKALRNMCSNGQIPYYKLGRRNRFRKIELQEMILESKVV